MATTTSARQADHALDSLPPRPPTPPKEASSRIVSGSIKTAVRQSLSRSQSLQTPPSIQTLISPATTESNPSSGRLRKKVEWSTHTEYNDAPQYQAGGRLAKSSPVAAAGGPSRPIKSILKASSSPCQPSSTLNSRFGSLDDQISIIDMLDSTIKQLTGADRDSKVDAYMTLARALKTSNNLPDRVALQGKLSLLTQFIQRDITLKSHDGGIDRSLVNHALVLLTTFLHLKSVSSAIPFEFAIFITDHAIRSFEDDKMPKEVIRYLMQVMAFQSFSPKVMSPDRVGRLLVAIHRLEGHLSGKSIVMSRIQLYKRLVTQCPLQMVPHASWLQDLFTDVLSLTKEIRVEAISLGMEAGFRLRHEKQVLRNALEVLQTEGDEKSFVQYYIERLSTMLKDRNQSASVPQIWQVVNLFLRCPLERWEMYGPWLRVVQSAFNTADGPTKHEANYAWNRYVYLSLMEGKPTSKCLSTLSQPLLSQLRKKASLKQPIEAERLRQTVIGGVCNLFYYAFRPGNDRLSPETVWDVALRPIMSQLLGIGEIADASSDGSLQAATILTGLLDGTTGRMWRDDRIRDDSLIEPKELPALDPKWIRRNVDRVFETVAVIVQRRPLDLANNESVVSLLWHSLVRAIATASSKDIKVSEDTLKFFACAFGLLYKMWSTGVPADEAGASSRFLTGISNMVQTMISGLGVLPFNEKKLSMTMPNVFESIATPSARSDPIDRSHGVVRSPLLHLLNLYCTVPLGAADDETLSNLILSTFEPFLKGKSEKARLEQTREFLRELPRSVVCPYGIWLLASQSLELPFMRPVSASEKGDKILGPEYREMISFLDRGLTCHPNLPLDRWLALLDLVDSHVLQAFGYSGRVLVIIEPLAKILIDVSESDMSPQRQQSITSATARLLDQARFPRDKQAMDAARRRLWGAAPAASQHDSFKPFDHLYRLEHRALNSAYAALSEAVDKTLTTTLLDATSSFIANSSQHAESVLTTLEESLCVWIADEEGRLSLGTDTEVAEAVRRLWSEICKVLITIGKPRNGRLGPLEQYLSCACASKQGFIVAMAAETWNKMVESVDEPECSDSLKSILSSLSSRFDVEMSDPQLPSNESGAQVLSPSHRQGSHELLKPSLQSSDSLSKQPVSGTTLSPPKAFSIARAKLLEITPRRTRSRANKRNTTPRLRHDNSQIEFIPVASSSPVPEDSQHLTERQKEVRERQKIETTAYGKPRSEDPVTKEAQSQVVHIDQSQPPEEPFQREQATPEPRASYEDLISSTPTPRRGQVIQMEDLNDPPSSPPEPRSYPLLNEIRTRSKTSSSLEDWGFSSSPPNSPSTDDFREGTAGRLPLAPALAQETTADAQLPQVDSVDLSTDGPDFEAGYESTSKPKQIEITITSSKNQVPRSSRQSKRQKRRKRQSGSSEAEPPITEVPARRTRSQAQQVPAAGSSGNLEATSFESRDNADRKGMQAAGALVSSRGQSQLPQVSAQTDFDTGLPVVVDIDEPQPVEDSTGNMSDGRNKRKNMDEKQEGSLKKRHKVSRLGNTEAQRSASPPRATASAPNRKLRARRGRRTRVSQGQQGEYVKAEETVCESQAAPDVSSQYGDDVGDTEDELLSQLMADSQAASQSQSQSRRSQTPPSITMADVKATPEVSAQEDPTADVLHEEEKGPKVLDTTAAVLEMLRNGTELLRGTTISRKQVDEIETMMMDLKREVYQAEFRGREQ